MATPLATAFVRVMPDTAGFGPALTTELKGQRVAGEAEKAAAATGKTFGNALTREANTAISQNAGTVGQTLSRSLGTASGLGTALKVAAVGVGLVGAGLAGAAISAANFQSKMSGVQAVSGASASQMNDLRGKALQLGQDTVFSASQAADAIGELVKAGVSIPDVMHGAADATVALAAASGIDLAQAATIAAQSMNAFQLSAADLPKVADTIAGAANASAIDVSQFGFSLQSVGAVAHLAGFSFHDTAVAIAEMGNAGIVGQDAGTSLKTMFQNLQPHTVAAAEEFKALGIITADGGNKFYDAAGKVKSLAEVSGILTDATARLTPAQKQMALSTAFGTDAVRAAAIVTQNGAAGFNSLAAAMDKVKAADVAKTRMNNLQGSLQALQGSVETVAIKLGTALLPALTTASDGANSLVNHIGPLAHFLSDNKDAVIGLAVAFGAVKFESLAASFVTGAVSIGRSLDGIRLKGMLAADSLRALGGGSVLAGGAIAATGIGVIALAVGSLTAKTLAQNKAWKDAAEAAKAYQDQAERKFPTDAFGDPTKFAAAANALEAEARAQVKASTNVAAASETWKAYGRVRDDLKVKEDKAVDTVWRLTQAYGINSDQVHTVAKALGIDLTGNAKAAFDAFSGLQHKMEAGSPIAGGLSVSFRDLANRVKDADGKVKTFQADLDVLIGRNVGVVQAVDAFQIAVAKLGDNVDKTSHSLLGNTEAAAGNRDQIAGLVTQAITAANAIGNQKAATDGATAGQEANRQALLLAIPTIEAAALKVGFHKDQVAGLLTQMGLLPLDKVTQLDVIDNASAKLSGVRQIIDDIKSAGIVLTPGDRKDIYGSRFADGGFLPSQATISPGSGRGLVQWAEGSTGGEAFIPLSPSKRDRSLDIWAQTGKMLGAFADGGFLNSAHITLDQTKISEALSTATAGLAGLITPAFGGGGGAGQWTGIATQVLQMLGRPLSELGALLRRINFESGGNPFAINLTDSNAAAGHPSQGLMQTIPGTFAAYAGPFRGLGITNPLANIYAGAAYAISRYGSIAAIDPLVRHAGYDSGGWLMPGTTVAVNKTGRPEKVTTADGEDRQIALMKAHIERLDQILAVLMRQPAATGYAVSDALNGLAPR